MSEHFIKNCKKCNIVMGQCRCPSKEKRQDYGICDKCSKMTEQAKYTINKSNDYIIDLNYEHYATFEIRHHAELVCRLLNQNEERKSLPKIDEDIRYEIERRLVDEWDEMQNFTLKKGVDEKYKNAIKIIKSLESEE